MLRPFYVDYEAMIERKLLVFFLQNIYYYDYIEVHSMRTNIVLNDELVKHAFKFSKAKTVNELIHEALEELIAVRQRSDIRDLRGKIAFREDYDHKPLRKGARSGSC